MFGIGQMIGGPVGAPIYGARNIGQIGGGPAPIQQNPNVGMGFGMPPQTGGLQRTAVIGMDQNPNVGMGFGMPAPIQQNPNVGIGFGMPQYPGNTPYGQPVAGPVAPQQNQQYFQQLHQGMDTMQQALKQMEGQSGGPIGNMGMGIGSLYNPSNMPWGSF